MPPECNQTALGTPAPRSKKAFRWSIRFLLLVLLIGVVLLSLKDRILKSIAERRIGAETGLAVKIGQLKLGLRSSTLTVKDLTLYNSLEFGGAPLVDIRELCLTLDASQVAAGTLHLKYLRLHLAELNVVRNLEGQLNLDALQKKSERVVPSLGFGGIDRMELTLGQANYSDLKQPKNNRVFVLGVTNEVVTNLKTSKDLTNWFGNFAFRLAFRELLKMSDQSAGKRMELDIGGPRPAQ